MFAFWTDTECERTLIVVRRVPAVCALSYFMGSAITAFGSRTVATWRGEIFLLTSARA